jgi:hypothetical protein
MSAAAAMEKGGGSGAARSLEQHIDDVRNAARDCGLRNDSLEGRFVSALLAAIVASSETQLATTDTVLKILADAKAVGDAEVRRLKIAVEGGIKAIDLGTKAVEVAAAASDRAEMEFQRSVAQVAEEMSGQLIEATQKWLVLKQTSRNRQDAWILSCKVAVVAVCIFIGGYASGSNLTGLYETQQWIVACKKNPISVRDGSGDIRSACWLDRNVDRKN